MTNDTIAKTRSSVRFACTAETSAVLKLMEGSKVGDMITYDTLSEIIKESAQQKGRHIVDSARRIAIRDFDQVWECVTNVGIKLANGPETIDVADHARMSIRNKAKRTVGKLQTVEIAELGNADKNRMLTALAQHGALAHFSSPRAAKQIANAANGTELDLNKTIRLFAS